MYLKLYIPLKNKPKHMKHLVIILLTFYCVQLGVTDVAPLTMEDKKMDGYLTNRKPATLTIQVKNLPDSVKKVDIKCSLVNIGVGFQATKHAETDAKGFVEITLQQNLPYQQIWLSVGDYLYAGVYVNTGLTVTIDALKIPKDGAYMIGEGITYAGIDGELNTVMNKKVLYRKKENEALNNALRDICHSRKKYTTALFSHKVDSIRNQLTQINDEVIKQFPNYAWAIKNEELSGFYGTLTVSYWGDTMPDQLFNEVSKHQPFFTSNDGALYYQYLNIYSNYLKNVKGKTLESRLKVFDSLYTQQKSDIIKVKQLETEKDNFATSYPLIIKSIQTNWCKKIAVNELAKAINNQKKIDSLFAMSTKITQSNIGTPLVKLPFEADLYQLDQVKNIDDFIVNLKLKFPNKAIVIDFWATWCAPCLSDLPSSVALHKKNKDLPIEYIYLCTTGGSNLQLWKNKVAELQIPGTHIFVNEKVIDRLKTALNAEGGFPAYVVIDVNNKIKPKAITRMGDLDRESLKKVTGL
jgi:thiol-disulfide isomerase/thioredoxin